MADHVLEYRNRIARLQKIWDQLADLKSAFESDEAPGNPFSREEFISKLTSAHGSLGDALERLSALMG